MIAERPGGKIKHDCDFWIAEPGFCFPLGGPDLPQVLPGDRPGRCPGGRSLTAKNHRAPGSPRLQSVREYGTFFLIIKEF
jgi:hypothetical protein